VHILRLQRRADISKARRELGYEPTPIAAAVGDAYAFYRERGMLRNAARTAAVPSEAQRVGSP
jgi:hypothetical protein